MCEGAQSEEFGFSVAVRLRFCGQTVITNAGALILTLNDSFAYIPLFALTAIAALLLLLLVIVRKKSTARVSFIAMGAVGLLLVASLFGAVSVLRGNSDQKAFLNFITCIMVGSIVFIPYLIMLATFEPKKIDKLVPKSFNERALKAAEQVKKVEEKPKELSESDKVLMDINRDFMAHSAEAYASDDGYGTFLSYINKTIKEQINADGAAILMVDDFEDIVSVKVFDGDFPPPYKLPSDLPHKPVRVSTNFKFATFPLYDNIFGEVTKGGRPELITKPEMDSRIYQNGPEEFLECGSYIMVPLKVGDTVIGLTAFARKNGTEKFNEQHLKVATTLTDFAAAMIKNVISVKDIIEKSEMNKESEIAMRIQNMLKPAKLPLIKGLQLSTVWNPAEGVCGDFYDVVVSRKDRITFTLGDIAGKGVNSMVVMTMVRAMFRLVVNTTQTAGKILTWVNKGLCSESFSTDHFGSVALINYDPLTKKMELSSAGVAPVYYYDSSTDDFKILTENSEPIGVEKTAVYKDLVQEVKSGDIIVAYTDGIVEAQDENGQQYTTDTLLSLIKKNHAKPGKELANIVKADVKRFSGNAVQHNDETLLIVKIQ